MGRTPKLSNHARQRCAEMGLSTKVAKRIVQHPAITRPGPDNSVIIIGEDYPEYAVAVTPDREVVKTVLFNTREVYQRQGTTYISLEEVS